MAKGKEIANGTRRGDNGSKNKKNSKSKSNSRKGDGIETIEKPEVITVSDSENDHADEEQEEFVQDEGRNDEKEEANTFGDSNRAENGDGKEREKVTKKNKNGKRKSSDGDDSFVCFPMQRISRIIKSKDADIRITQESVFLVNKATENFLELFCREAYANALLDTKNQVWYKHLSSVVSTRKRFDFLLDIVPEKMRAEDALAEMSVAET